LESDGLTEQIETERSVFVDEMGTNTSFCLPCTLGGTQRPEGLLWSVPRNRGANTTTVLSSMSVEGMGPSLSVEGSTTSVVFEAYVEQVLAPTLRSRGQVVVMDNLFSAHKGERIEEMIEGRGCQLLYLPSYSLRISTPSRKRSRRSRGSCVRPKPGRKRPWSRRLVWRYLRSAPRTLVVSLSTAATGCRFNHYGDRGR
jgi:hypothetical protein